MGQSQDNADQSVDEIIASIRRIMEFDGATGKPQPNQPAAPAAAHQPLAPAPAQPHPVSYPAPARTANAPQQQRPPATPSEMNTPPFVPAPASQPAPVNAESNGDNHPLPPAIEQFENVQPLQFPDQQVRAAAQPATRDAPIAAPERSAPLNGQTERSDTAQASVAKSEPPEQADPFPVDFPLKAPALTEPTPLEAPAQAPSVSPPRETELEQAEPVIDLGAPEPMVLETPDSLAPVKLEPEFEPIDDSIPVTQPLIPDAATSDASGEEMLSARTSLTDTLGREIALPPAPPAPADPLDAAVGALLRPMIKEWIDENLPRVVKEIAREQIAARDLDTEKSTDK